MNQLAFPGFGTVMAGRAVGYVQGAVMVVGFFLVTGFLVGYIFHAVQCLLDPTLGEPDYLTYRKHLWVAALGLGLCAGAWFWSLFSSIQIVRGVTTLPPPLPVPPKKV